MNVFLLNSASESCYIYQWTGFYERIIHPLHSLIFLINTHFLSELLSIVLVFDDKKWIVFLFWAIVRFLEIQSSLHYFCMQRSLMHSYSAAQKINLFGFLEKSSWANWRDGCNSFDIIHFQGFSTPRLCAVYHHITCWTVL